MSNVSSRAYMYKSGSSVNSKQEAYAMFRMCILDKGVPDPVTQLQMSMYNHWNDLSERLVQNTTPTSHQ